mmetsp:Transcript_27446/g.63272  ORF Transcript_27446/g.63272 Transcript_27446/m.63272 type:complete len:104 (+) Transcript_27446:156-467(+)
MPGKSKPAASPEKLLAFLGSFTRSGEASVGKTMSVEPPEKLLGFRGSFKRSWGTSRSLRENFHLLGTLTLPPPILRDFIFLRRAHCQPKSHLTITLCKTTPLS